MIELASFRPFSEIILQFLDQLTETIGVVLSTIIANVRTEQLLEQSQSQSHGAAAAVAGAPDPAGAAPGDERGAPGEGGAAREPEPRHRDQEPRDRAGPQLAGGEGRAARAQLEVQVGVPREHVARAAHAAQLAPDPVEGAGLERARQPERQAGRVRGHDPQRRLGPARADQRHPRPVEGRGGQDGRARRADLAGGRARLRGALVPTDRRGEGAALRDRARARRPRGDRDRRAAAPAGAEEPALERVQVHRGRRGAPHGRPCAGGNAVRGRLARAREVGHGVLGRRTRGSASRPTSCA